MQRNTDDILEEILQKMLELKQIDIINLKHLLRYKTKYHCLLHAPDGIFYFSNFYQLYLEIQRVTEWEIIHLMM